MKRVLLSLLLAALVFVPSLQGQVASLSGGATTFVCGQVALANTLTKCIGSLGSALRFYVTDVVAQTTTATAGTYAVRSGSGTNCGTNTKQVFPSSYPANTTSATLTAPISTSPAAFINFRTPIPVAVGDDLCVIGTATNTVTIEVHGFVAAQ